MLIVSDKWRDYELIDAGGSERLERWQDIIVRRPDPQVLWDKDKSAPWDSAQAVYNRSKEGGGQWRGKRQMPDQWVLSYQKLKFIIRPTDFKHMGLFPEQGVNWNWVMNKITDAGRPIRLLNLFAYTGGASVAAAAAGAQVSHVDAAKGMVSWAKENLHASGLGDKPVRFLVDDVVKFVQREQRRGVKYDAIIMDPPSYGRGTKGETWKVEAGLLPLLNECRKVLSDDPLLFLINAYTTGLSSLVLHNLLQQLMNGFSGEIEHGEVGLPLSSRPMVLPCGVFSRWSKS